MPVAADVDEMPVWFGCADGGKRGIRGCMSVDQRKAIGVRADRCDTTDEGVG